MTKKCEICGKEFEPRSNRQKACSPKCAAEQNRRGCAAQRKKQEADNGAARYCVICGGKLPREEWSRLKCGACANAKKKIKTERYCHVCGKVFSAEEGERRYICSEGCADRKARWKGKKARSMSCAEVQRAAQAEGLSYGKYVLKHGI